MSTEPRIAWNRNLQMSLEHLGACCGRGHLFDFCEVEYYIKPPLEFDDRVAGIRDKIKRTAGSGQVTDLGGELDRKGLCIEAVINDHQRQWEKPLLAVGFEKVFSFVNQNSGNTCYVYLLDTSKMK